jgi:sulfatase maturation enzyme AslB (radical SAM superfamily)
MIDLKQNKAFCILPFIHLHVNEGNNVKLCCFANEPTGAKKYTDNFDFDTDPDFQAVRTKLIAGERIPHCQNCYNYEDGGASSTRTRDSAEWFEKLQWTNADDIKPNLVYYDIRNDNICNLSCRMCNPQSSSQIAKEYKKLKWSWHLGDTVQTGFGFNNVVDMDTVQSIQVAGGEPSLMPEFKTFLERAIKTGRTDIAIRMNTNATNLNKEYRELLGHFPNLDIICSIDGYDQVNKYIRWPADWPTLVENIKELCKITPKVSFNVTVSIWNISSLSQLIEFFEQNHPGSHVLLNQVMYPIPQLPTTFPYKEIALADLTKLTNSVFYKDDCSGFRSKVDYYITAMQSTNIDLDALKSFFEYNDALDRARGIKLIDYIPELEQARSLIKDL